MYSDTNVSFTYEDSNGTCAVNTVVSLICAIYWYNFCKKFSLQSKATDKPTAKFLLVEETWDRI